MNSYVTVSIMGKNPKLFLKRYIINKISYKKLKIINYKKIILRIKYEDYINISNKHTIYKINVISYSGPIKYLLFCKQNFSFLISFIISLILLFILSNTIFEIKIVHNNKNIRNLIKDELKYYKIEKFKFIPNFNKRKNIINKIINRNKSEIEWLEIERKGSKLVIKVTERKVNKKEEQIPNRHIVAKKSGIILKIEADNGVIIKKINDYVVTGDIIISGDIIKDETVKGQVPSKGIVYAETWYRVNVEYPLHYKEVKYLSEVKNNIIINFMGNKYPLKKNYSNFYLEKKKILIKEKIFPFTVSIQKQRKTKVTDEVLTIESAIKKAENLAEKKIMEKLSKDEYVISKKTLNFNKKESKIVVDVFFKVYENITSYKEADSSLLKIPEVSE